MKKEQAAFAERLRQMLLQQGFGLNRRHLAQRLSVHGQVSVTEQTVGGWLNGRHIPKPDAMRGLATMLGTEPYLLEWGGKRRLEVQEPRLAWPERVSGPNRLAFEAFLSLPEDDQNTVRKLIASLASAGAPRKSRIG